MRSNKPPTYLFVAVNETGEKGTNSVLTKPVIRLRSPQTRRQAEIRHVTPRDESRLGGHEVTSTSLLQDTDSIHDEEAVAEDGPAHARASTWTFMPVDPASAQPTSSARHNIRAHVAKRQHRQRRELEAQLNRSVSENDVLTATRRDGQVSSSRSPPSLLSSRSSSSTNISTSNPPPSAPISLLLDPSNPTDQLHLYARQLSTTVPTLWSCYLYQERRHGALFHAQNPHFKGWGPKFLHPLILTNHAILATTVLFTACLMRHRANEPTILSDEILALGSRTYGLVQAAVDSGMEQIADGTILAVLKLALYEAIFGRVEAYRVHMQGLGRIVALRGGLEGLGMRGYLARLLVWFDVNLSAATRSVRYLGGETVGEVKADEEEFVLGVELRDVKLFADIL